MHHPGILNLELDAVTGPGTEVSPSGRAEVHVEVCVVMSPAEACEGVYVCGERCVDVELPKSRLH